MKRPKPATGYFIKILSVLAAAALAAALLAGCSGSKPEGQDGTGAADLSFAEAGGTFTFGRYEQNGTEDDGPEPIEWTVLSDEGGKLLAVSKYALESMEFDSADGGTTWENSSLKAWLNGEFFDGAFNDAEKAKISDADAGRVFLLTAEDAETYFASDEDRIAPGTEHAYSGGLFRTDGGGAWWWLRTAGTESDSFAGVDGNGVVNRSGNAAHRVEHGVRPAILIEP